MGGGLGVGADDLELVEDLLAGDLYLEYVVGLFLPLLLLLLVLFEYFLLLFPNVTLIQPIHPAIMINLPIILLIKRAESNFSIFHSNIINPQSLNLQMGLLKINILPIIKMMYSLNFSPIKINMSFRIKGRVLTNIILHLGKIRRSFLIII